MHFPCSDLHFEFLAGGAEDRGVDGTVAVLLGVGDVVVELAGDARPRRMHHAQHPVAVVDVRHQHPHRLHVAHFGKGDGLVAHLPPNAVEVLGAALHFAFDARVRQAELQILANRFHLPFAGLAAAVQIRHHFLVLFRIQVAEGEIFERPLELPDAEPPGQRREELDRFARHDVPRRAVERLAALAGVAQGDDSFRQLRDRHPRIVDQRDQQMPHVLGLASRLRRKHRGILEGEHVHGVEAQHRAHQFRHFPRQRFDSDVAALYGEQRHAGHHRHDVHLQLPEQLQKREAEPARFLRGNEGEHGSRHVAAVRSNPAGVVQPEVDVRLAVRQARHFGCESAHVGTPAGRAPSRLRVASRRPPRRSSKARLKTCLAARRTMFER